MGTSDNFCLRWNDFETNISTSFRELRRDSEFFDVTLCCDNGSDRVPAHKVILAACSPLFRRILHGVNASSSPHPLLYLKGIQKKELTAILNFMYHGEVNVAQDSLNAFLAVAEELAVKGLTTDSKPEGFAGSAHATSSAGGGAAASAAVDDPSDPDYSATGSSKKRPVKKTPASAAKLARKRPDDDDDDGGDVKRVKAEPDVMIPDDDEGVAGGSGVGGAGAGPDFGDDEFGGGGGEGFDDSYGGYDDLEDNGGLDTTGGAGGGGEVTKGALEILEKLNKLWYCKLCAKIYDKKHKATRHAIDTHLEADFEFLCPKCPSIVSTRDSLVRHLNRYHEMSLARAAMSSYMRRKDPIGPKRTVNKAFSLTSQL